MQFPRYTPRLNIRQIAGWPQEAATIVGWLNDPDVVRFSEQRHYVHNLQTQLLYMKGFVAPNIYLGIYTPHELLIGTMTIYHDTPNKTANVGIMIGEKTAWGKGFGIEAWTAICNDLFEDGVRKVEAGCMGINYRMMAICQHYGMVEEGRQLDHYQVMNGTADLVHWGKFNEAS